MLDQKQVFLCVFLRSTMYSFDLHSVLHSFDNSSVFIHRFPILLIDSSASLYLGVIAKWFYLFLDSIALRTMMSSERVSRETLFVAIKGCLGEHA